MASQGIGYLIQGRRHWVVLTVSLWSLRRRYAGPVVLLVGDEQGMDLAERLSGDRRVSPIQIVRYAARTGSGDAAVSNKPKVYRYSPFASTVILDADTLVVGDFDELWPRGDEAVFTTFADWTTQRKPISGRVSRWQPYAPELVDRALSQPVAAINTGAFEFTSGCEEFMRAWSRLTDRWISFACDELAAQLLYPDYRIRLVDDRFNCSPIYGHGKADVRIWHFHGKKHLKGEAAAIWWPAYAEALKENVAEIRSWTPADDLRLAEFLAVEGQRGCRSNG